MIATLESDRAVLLARATLGRNVVAGVIVGVVVLPLAMAFAVASSARPEQGLYAPIVAGLGADFVLPKDTVVYSIDGPFFFGAAENLEKTLRRGQSRVRTIVIGIGQVPFMDTTGLRAMNEIMADFQRVGTRVTLCEVRANVREKLECARILTRLGAGGLCDTLAQFASMAGTWAPGL